MSKFSEQLKILIESSGLTIYTLAKTAGLDRTTIQRSITGDRLPSTEFVEKLCSYLRVTPAERKQILELHLIEKIGEKTYISRKYVKELLEKIATLHIRSESSVIAKKQVEFNFKQDCSVFNGELNVNNIVRDVLEDEAFNNEMPTIRMNVPFEYGYFFDCLLPLYWNSKGRYRIEHILPLSKNPYNKANPNCNLETLAHMFEFAFCVGDGYRPNYYYSNADISTDISLAMPYYFFTAKYVLTLSADYKNAILYNNRDVFDTYNEEFRKSKSQTTPLLQLSPSCDDFISSFIQASTTCGLVTHVIEPHPCFAKFYSEEMVTKHLHPEIPNWEEVHKVVWGMYATYISQWQAKSTFTSEGLAHLVHTGRLADLPPQFATPFTVEERKYLLSSLRKAIDDDVLINRAVNPQKMTISQMACIQVYENGGLIITVTEGELIVSCYIEEASISSAFADFLESLPQSDLVYTKEETIALIDEYINELNTMG